MNMSGLYRSYAEHLRERYGGKVYKLPVNLPGSCPNRDGILGVGGCIFCDEDGAGFECLPNTLSVQKQLSENKAFFRRRFNANKFIAYFQAFTNTYMPLDVFKKNILAAIVEEDLVGISISTRPDCINDRYMEFLSEIKEKHGLDITLELGLQTANYHTLQQINRGHSLAEYLDAVRIIQGYDLDVCTHLILNLPWDDETDVVENAKILSALHIQYVKLHSLYIVKNTEMGRMYEQGQISLISLEEYINRVILFLEYLSPQIVVQRLVGKGPQGNLYFCNWDTSWWKIKAAIEEKMQERASRQGLRCDYLNGRAVRHFIG